MTPAKRLLSLMDDEGLRREGIEALIECRKLNIKDYLEKWPEVLWRAIEIEAGER